MVLGLEQYEPGEDHNDDGLDESHVMRSWLFTNKDDEQTVNMDVEAMQYVCSMNAKFWRQMEQNVADPDNSLVTVSQTVNCTESQ